jgi:farnesyl diphosphate synthase
MAQKTTLREFESVFPKLKEALIEHAEQYKLPQMELEWYKTVSVAQSRSGPCPNCFLSALK